MRYDNSYDPPAPVLRVKIKRPLSNLSMEILAKLDTGADITVVPQEIIEKLRLVPVSRISVSSFSGQRIFKYSYFADIEIQKYNFSMVEIIGGRRKNMLLGRNILNKLKIILDGKKLTFNLYDP